MLVNNMFVLVLFDNIWLNWLGFFVVLVVDFIVVGLNFFILLELLMFLILCIIVVWFEIFEVGNILVLFWIVDMGFIEFVFYV